MKNYGGLEDWNFQERLRVIESRYSLVMMPNAEFDYRVNKSPGFPISIKQEPTTGSIDFETKKISGLTEEP